MVSFNTDNTQDYAKKTIFARYEILEGNARNYLLHRGSSWICDAALIFPLSSISYRRKFFFPFRFTPDSLLLSQSIPKITDLLVMFSCQNSPRNQWQMLLGKAMMYNNEDDPYHFIQTRLRFSFLFLPPLNLSKKNIDVGYGEMLQPRTKLLRHFNPIFNFVLPEVVASQK